MLSFALFFLSTPAFAGDDTQTTDMGGQEAVNAIGSLYAAQQAAEQRLAALEAARLRCLEGCKKATKKPAPPVKPQAVEIAPIAPPVPTPDPELELAKAELAAAKRAYEAAVAAMAAMKPPVVENTFAPEITVQPAPVVIAPKPTRLIGYVGGGVIFAGPVPDVSGPVAGRAVMGLRPSVKIPGSDNKQLGVVIEGSYENLGVGARVMPELIIGGSTGEWAVGGGLGYACNAWQGNGCLAEYFGGVAQGTWSPGRGPVGMQFFLNGEFGGLSVSGQENTASAFRVVFGATLRIGNAQRSTVTVPE